MCGCVAVTTAMDATTAKSGLKMHIREYTSGSYVKEECGQMCENGGRIFNF